MAFDVGGFNFQGPKPEQSGFGLEDIRRAIDRPNWATKFQIRQLYQRAKKEGIETGPIARTIESAGGGDAWDPRLKEVFHERWPGMTGIPEQSKISGGGHDFGDAGHWGFGRKDLALVTTGNKDGGLSYDTSHLDRVQTLSDWATEQGIGVGHEVPSWLNTVKGIKDMEDKLGASNDQINTLNDQIQNQVAEEMPVVEPPKPSFRGAGGHFVPGTARVQGYKIPKASRSRSLAGRFGRRGSGFQSALSIASGNQGATQSKVLNV